MSFLHFLRQALKPHVGPTAFTDGEGQNIFVETDFGEAQPDDVELSLEEKRLMLQSYFEAVGTPYAPFGASKLTRDRPAAY